MSICFSEQAEQSYTELKQNRFCLILSQNNSIYTAEKYNIADKLRGIDEGTNVSNTNP